MQNSLALGITIGASLSGTVGRAFGSLDNQVARLGDSLRRVRVGRESAQSVIRYREQLNRLRQQQQQFGLGNTRLWGQIAQTERALRDAERAAEGYGVNIGDIVRENNRLIQSEQRVQRQLARTETRRRNSQTRGQIGGQVVGAVGLAYAASAPLKAAIEFESVMADVNKVVDLSRSEFKGMSRDILQMSTKMPMAASGIGAIIEAAGQSNIAKDQLLGFAKSAVMMGVAFDLSGAEAGKMMADWRNGMNLTQAQTNSLADAVNYLSNNMNASAPAIGQVIQRQGAVAKAAGLTEIQTAALSAALLSSGTAPEIAATALKNLTGALTKGTAASAGQRKAFSALGLDALSMSKRMQVDAKGAITDVFRALERAPKSEQGALVSLLFGEESKGAIMPLLTNLDNLTGAFAKTDDKMRFSGSMLQEYQTRSKTTANNLQLLKNQTTRLGISVGSVLLPALNDVVGVVGGVVGGVTGAAESFPVLTKVIVGAGVGLVAFKVVALSVGYVGTILSDAWVFATAVFDFFRLSTMRANAALVVQKAVIIGTTIQQKALAAWTASVTAAQWLWNAALTANPIGLIIVGVAAFGALAVTVYKKWEPIKQFFKDLWQTVKRVFPLLNVVGSAVSGLFAGDAPSPVQAAGGGNKKAAAVLGAALAAPATAALPADLPSAKPAAQQVMNNQQYHFNVTQLPGEDAEQLARRITEIQQEAAQRGEMDVR